MTVDADNDKLTVSYSLPINQSIGNGNKDIFNK